MKLSTLLLSLACLAAVSCKAQQAATQAAPSMTLEISSDKMEKLQIVARFQIQPGQAEAFKEIAATCLDIVKEKDPGTLQYDVYYSPDGSECVVHEVYASSDALLAHMGNVGEYLGQLLAISSFSAEIYGNPSDAVNQAVEGLKVSVYDYASGM